MNADFRARPVGNSRGKFSVRDAGSRSPRRLGQHADNGLHVAKRRRFVERDADVRAVEVPEIQPGALGDRLHGNRRRTDAVRHLNAQRVEVGVVLLAVAQGLCGSVERGREGMRAPRDRLSPSGP